MKVLIKKKCFKCGKEKSRSEFYKHPQMGDGLLGKCKECTKADTKKQYRDNPEARKEYERKRGRTEHRKTWAINNQRKVRIRDPIRYKARGKLLRAVQSGKIQRLPCEFEGLDCFGEIQAHHEDYSKPLEVRWLCFKHHCHVEGRSIECEKEQACQPN